MILKTPLQQFDGTAIPQYLKALPLWAPWKAVWNAKRGKYDKLPKNAKRPEYGISTASPEKWATHAEALAAYQNADGMLDGIGLVMTGLKGLIGIDLDNCVDNGVVAPWALEVVKTFGSYTEVSPSGRGLRTFALGDLDGPDWNNHEVGIEVYAGSSPRYLTVTGRALPGTPNDLRPASAAIIAGLRGAYGRATSAVSTARADLPPMPDVLDELATPSVQTLELPPAVRDFLTDGENAGDRSRALHSAAVALFSAGLAPQEVLSVLHHSPHAFEVALDHRRQDTDRADAYLWEHHCVKAQPKARPRALTAMDFDDLSASLEVPLDTEDDSVGGGVEVPDAGLPVAGGASAGGAGGGVASADDFDDVSGGAALVAKTAAKTAVKKPRFDIKTASEYAAHVKPMAWVIKGVLPNADMGAVFGESGSGKTFFVLDMMCRVAMGIDWFGIPTKRTRVLYIAAEGASGMRDRVKAWCIAHACDLSDLDGWLYILGDQPNMLEKEDVRALVAASRTVCPQVGVVVVDTMAQVTPGANENSGEDMGRFLSHLRALGKALRCMMVLVGHAGKDSARGLRGWSGIKAALDVEVETIRTKEFRAAVVTKLKDGAGEGREYRFTLDPVVVFEDFVSEDGDVVSCVAAHGEMLDESGARDTAAMERKEKTKEKAKAQRLSDRQAVVVEFLRTRAVGGAPVEALKAEIAALLTADGRDGVGFTAANVAKGQQTNEISKCFAKLEKRGAIRIENENLFFIADMVGSTPAETCDF